MNHVCAACGVGFVKPGRRHKYCSQSCYHHVTVGEVHAHYKGGGVSKGYHRTSVREKRVFTHRLLMEQHLGRKLDTTELIHHINGDGLDNRIENLKVVSPNNHMHEHRTLIHTDTHKQCCRCRVVKPRADFNLRRASGRDTHHGYCRQCQSEYAKAYYANSKISRSR